MYSILGKGSFCFNYCLNSAWPGGDQFVALLRWCGSPGFFDSGLQLICIFLVSCFSFFSWQYPIDSLLDSGLVSLLASQAYQHMVILPTFGAFGSVGRCQILLENEISISIKLVSRWKHKVLQNLLVDGCIVFELDKTQWTNTSKRGTPNHFWLQNFHTGLQATWILCLSTLPPDSGTLISKWNATFTFIWKEDFGPLSNSPVMFLFSPGKMLLTLFLVQKWFGSFPEDVWASWLLMHWLQLQFTPCEALPSVWIGFSWQYSQAYGHPCCLCTFSYPISSFQSTLKLSIKKLKLLIYFTLHVMNPRKY